MRRKMQHGKKKEKTKMLPLLLVVVYMFHVKSSFLDDGFFSSYNWKSEFNNILPEKKDFKDFAIY